ncbi:hypothetical protein CWC33_05985 [Idiomarina sp. X4]|uniref:Eco57I restriction-modification methylase domain-containing protein n=1 Tax=Idiomarina sp. X4 TaxID=2055892 RepID=UPI000C28C81C|nr:Eco57I restriction-modification methylase domain-containing protein [Idiomarina sp. X4]ATZ73273.1 hypothetical protein CWC33_05985 [Idiomarina sp. X4]
MMVRDVLSIDVALHSMNDRQLYELALETDVDPYTIHEIHNMYVRWSSEKKLRLSNGIVCTPYFVAEYMVAESFGLIGASQKDVSWYDPCCGSGIFLEAIIKKYLDNNREISVDSLPKLRARELSPVGVFLSLLVVKKLLKNYGISFKKYIESGRFSIFCGDALSIYTERKTLLDLDPERFDVVIGNPPYVRSTRIGKNKKIFLKDKYPDVYTGTADLYFYFISNALEALKDNGVLNFISPAGFFRTKSADKLREKIYHSARLRKLIDLDELQIFENADIHTTIYWLNKSTLINDGSSFKYSHLKKSDDLISLKQSEVKWETKIAGGTSEKKWTFSRKESDYDFSQHDNLVTLKEAGFKIYSGIRPAYKKAYVYKAEDIQHLSADLKSKWFIPCMEGRDLSSWQSKESGKFLLFIPKGTVSIPEEIMSLLEEHRVHLTSVNRERRGEWYSLRSCSYYPVFRKSRIVFPDISATSRFSLETRYSINLDGTFVIDTSNLALLGLLNSKIAWNFYLNNYSSIGNATNKGRLRFKKHHIEEMLIPKAIVEGSDIVSDINKIVISIVNNGMSLSKEHELNRLVDKLYNESK